MSKEMLDAVKAGDVARVESLLRDMPERANAIDNSGLSALMTALYYRQQKIAELIAAVKPSLSPYEAAALGDEKTLREHLKMDPGNIHGFAPDGFPLLGLAAYFGREKIVAILMEKGADPNREANNGSRLRPIHAAVAAGHQNLLRLLLKHGADPNVGQKGGFTPLMSAAHRGSRTMVEMLLEAGADVTLKSEAGETAKDFALKDGHVEIAALLG